ncbi:MAG: hypothetical protein MUD17_04755 [Gemmatimonadaceae bacterium]|nr:hypothetical protein [Gemmatimonadaceae bacterium]
MAARLTTDAHQAPAGARARGPVARRPTVPTAQLGFFGEEPREVVRVEVRPDPALAALAEALRAIDPNRLTPIEALQQLAALREQAVHAPRGTVVTDA